LTSSFQQNTSQKKLISLEKIFKFHKKYQILNNLLTNTKTLSDILLTDIYIYIYILLICMNGKIISCIIFLLKGKKINDS
jgi:hypothetical protein